MTEAVISAAVASSARPTGRAGSTRAPWLLPKARGLFWGFLSRSAFVYAVFELAGSFRFSWVYAKLAFIESWAQTVNMGLLPYFLKYVLRDPPQAAFDGSNASAQHYLFYSY